MDTIPYFFASNPFIDAWIDSDLIGKGIFIGLVSLSIISWVLITYKIWMTREMKKKAFAFQRSFIENKTTPLSISIPDNSYDEECPNVAALICAVVQEKTKELLNGNNRPLNTQDISILESQIEAILQSIDILLSKHLYILATIVTLAPFLGLLGTVYGILTSFSSMQMGASGFSSQTVLSGLSLALTTTVIGLIDAIPALIGYNYLKNSVSNFTKNIEHFAVDFLTQIQIYPR